MKDHGKILRADRFLAALSSITEHGLLVLR
jgi:hypothetical protein